MTRHNEESRQQADAQGAPDRVDARRRRLLAAGASSPLLMTIASRPAWAQGGMCTASALASANASGGYDFDGCSISAGWWMVSKDRWPMAHTTPFHSVFAPVAHEGAIVYDGYTLGEVIDFIGSNDPAPGGGTFGLHLIGALMNALTFPNDQGVPGYAFTAQQVIDAYNQLAFNSTGSSFQAMANTLESANNQFDAYTEKPEPW